MELPEPMVELRNFERRGIRNDAGSEMLTGNCDGLNGVLGKQEDSGCTSATTTNSEFARPTSRVTPSSGGVYVLQCGCYESFGLFYRNPHAVRLEPAFEC